MRDNTDIITMMIFGLLIILLIVIISIMGIIKGRF